MAEDALTQRTEQRRAFWNALVTKERIAILERQAPAMAAAHVANASVVAGLLADQAPLWLRLSWWIALLATTLYPAIACLHHSKSATQSTASEVTRFVVIVAGLNGLTWAASVPLLAGEMTETETLVLMTVLAGTAAISAALLSAVSAAMIGSIVPLTFGAMSILLYHHDAAHIALAVLLALFCIIAYASTRIVYLTVADGLWNKISDVERKTELQDRLQALVGLGSDRFWESDTDGVLSDMDSLNAHQEDGEYERISFAGLRLLEDIRPDTDDLMNYCRRQIERQEPIRDVLCRVDTGDGATRYVLMNAIPRTDIYVRFLGYRGSFSDRTDVVVERKRAEHSETLLRDAIEALPDAVVLFDRQDRVALFNNLQREWFPTLAPVLEVGAPFEALVRQQIASGAVKPAAGREEEFVRKFTEHHINPQDEAIQYVANERVIRLRERRTSLGGIVAIRSDITELAHARQDVQRTAERFHDFANSSADWFWETDADLRFVWISDRITEVTGAPVEWHYGKTRSDLFADSNAPELSKAHAATLAAREPFRDFVYHRAGPDGRLHWVSASGLAYFDDDGEFLGYRGSARDVSTEIEAEQHARQTERLRSIGQLTGGVAHDFNNLLSAMLGSLDLMEDTVSDDPVARRSLEIAREAGQRGADLTQQLLAFGRKQNLNPEPTDIAKLIERTGELIRRSLRGTAELEIACDSDLPAALIDATQLQNALLNLAFNARDAMPDGGVLSIDCHLATSLPDGAMLEATAPAHTFLEIAVRDSGIGMDATVAERAMEPFFTTKSVGEGSGMGLSMVHGFITQSDGAITLESKPGKGTTIRLFLPVRTSADTGDDLPARSAAAPEAGNEAILLVEDNDLVRETLSMHLIRLGYRVTAVSSGAAARAAIARDIVLDILVTDLTLGQGVSGEAVARDFAAHYHGKPILVTSGKESEAGLSQLRETVGVTFLPKPASGRQIAETVRAVLDHYDRTPQQEARHAN